MSARMKWTLTAAALIFGAAAITQVCLTSAPARVGGSGRQRSAGATTVGNPSRPGETTGGVGASQEQSTGTVFGTVTAPDGTRVAGAQVSASLVLKFKVMFDPASGVLSAPPAPSPVGSAPTDSEGRYQIAVPPGKIRLVVDATGFAAATGEVDVLGGEEVRCDLAVVAGFRIDGRVLDAKGRPIAGATVTCVPMGNPSPSRRATAGEDGRFVLEDLVEGTHLLQAAATGYVRTPGRPVQTGTAGLECVLARGGRIEGKVVRMGDGTPARGASVSCDSPQELVAAPPSEPQVEVDAEGAFVVDGLAPGRYVIRAEAPGLAPGRSVEVRVPAGEVVRSVVVELTPGGTLRGVVLSTRGRVPVIGARVARITTEGVESAGAGPPRTREDGGFELRNLPVGRVTIEASHDRYATTRKELDIAEGGETRVEFLMGESCRVSGRVFDRQGAPVAGAIVSATGAEAILPRTAKTDVSGRFELPGLAPGTWTVGLVAGDRGHGAPPAPDPRTVTIEEGETLEVDLRLPAAHGVTVSGTVRRGGGAVAGAMVLFTPTITGPSRSGETAADGRYEVDGLSPGEYSVLVLGLEKRLTIPVGTRGLRHDVELPAGDVRGRVLDATTREPVEGAAVRAYSVSGESLGKPISGGVSGADGGYVVSGVDDGDLALQVDMEGYATETRRVRVSGGGLDGQDFYLMPGSAISGRIVDVAGRPVAGATFTLRDGQGGAVVDTQRLREARSDEQGRFEVHDLQEGVFVLLAQAAGHAPARVEVAVPRSGRASIEIVLGPEATIRLRAREDSGAPVAGAVVEVFDAEGSTVESPSAAGPIRTDQEGVAGIGGLGPGRYRVRVAAGGLRGSCDVDAVPGRTVELDVALLADAPVR